MEVTLSPETTRQVRDVLGDDVDLSPGAVPSALSRLAVEAPRVYSQILAELSGTAIRLDSERVLARRRWWSAVRRHLFWWGEYESDAGDRLIAKRHVAAAVPFGLAGVILLLLGGSAMLRHQVSGAAARRPVVGVVPHPAFALPHVVEHPRVLAAYPNVLPPLVDLPTPPPRLPAWGAAASAPAQQGGPGAEPPRDPLVFHLDPGPAPTAATPAPRRADVGAAAGTGSPIVYDRDRDVAESAGLPTTASASSVGRAAGPVGGASAEQDLTTGVRVGARLATGVLVAMGGPSSPAIAETTSPSATWLGQATLGADGRVQIAFTVARRGDVVRGVALDPDRLVPGLTGRTELRHPQAAAAALTASAFAAAAYARALAQQGLALAGSWGQLTLGQPASPWAYLASSFADGMAPRSGVPGPVETSEISAGAPLVILVTEAP